MSACTPKSLASSGQKPIQEMCHPLGAEEAVLTPSPDVRNITSSIGEKDQILPNGTPVETSSPSSSSSLLNRLQLDDDLDGETRDLFVTVDDPKKHVSTMETYITYRVVTKVGRVLSHARCLSAPWRVNVFVEKQSVTLWRTRDAEGPLI
ncbi:sorting nexin-30-like [Oncorhynchus masou masou]|uniref:sorting nexin-30-like n=1 Tax=Oncorhynchus masou masou TaxID=90313 RepID=UPI003184374D